MKTYAPKPRDIERRWYVLDAEGVVLGRLATQAAAILRGKHKPIFAPNADTGDHLIIVNAKGVVLTGQKAEKKIAYRHSGYPGGLRADTYATLLAERPSRAVEKAIRGMLPKNSLGRQMLTKLRVYDGPEHEHQAQQPQPLRTDEIPAWSGLPGTSTPTLSVVPSVTAKIGARRASARPAAKVAEAPAPKVVEAKPAEAKPAEPAAAAPKPAAKAPKPKPKPKPAAAKTTAAKSTAKKSTAAKSTAKKTTATKPTAKKPTTRKK